MLTRRALLTGLASLIALPARAQTGDFAPADDPGFDRWKAGFADRAKARGIAADVVDQSLSTARFLPGVLAKDRGQFEFSLTFEDHLAITVSDERIKKGRRALAQHGPLLSRLQARFGVQAPVLAAIWGIESLYGEKQGEVPVISALASLAYEGRRAEFFEGQLLAALKIVAHGDVTAERMLGGWAGAMGHMQFIPTTYRAYAVDWTGDGRSDHWGDDPSDALASAASYLAESGWVAGQPSGAEVRLPKGGAAQVGKRRGAADWNALGVRLAGGGAVPDHGPAKLLQPQKAGPAFLVWRNFAALGHYNAATTYGLSVGILADRLAGGGPLETGFPLNREGLSQADRVRLQQQLTALGYDCGSVDGVFGPKTAAAVKGFQTARGLPVTGVATPELLAALR
jgi:membrane-bound lytic murein transglycosylase B